LHTYAPFHERASRFVYQKTFPNPPFEQ